MTEDGVLYYDKETDRYDVLLPNRRRGEPDCLGGLRGGSSFEICIDGEWKPTRMERDSGGWYLVGISSRKIAGRWVKIRT